MKKIARVHRLPTEDKTNIIENNSLDFIYHSSHKDYSHWGVGESEHLSYQHLYITSDEEIKEGDRIYDAVRKVGKTTKYSDYVWINKVDTIRKIIATTDPKLELYTPGIMGLQGEPLPQPSQAFIKAYCEQGGIDEVDVEYKYHKVWDQQTEELLEKYLILKVDPIHNTITTHRIVEKMYSKKEIPQLVVDILNHLNDNQENIDSDSDLLKYVAHYIK